MTIKTIPLRLLPICAALCCMSLVSCGGGAQQDGLTDVTGQVTLGGSAVPVDQNTYKMLKLNFLRFQDENRPEMPDLEEGDPLKSNLYSTFVDEDGSYRIRVPDGKYLILAHYSEGMGFDPSAIQNDKTDKFKGKFNQKNSKIIREVSGKTTIDINLDKAEG